MSLRQKSRIPKKFYNLDFLNPILDQFKFCDKRLKNFAQINCIDQNSNGFYKINNATQGLSLEQTLPSLNKKKS